MFYSGGLPFHLARNPYYISSYKFAANHNLDGFVPPGYNALRTTLLQKEKSNITRMLQPIKDTWPQKGISLVSDGWTDAQRRPLINFMAASEDGPVFLKAVDASGEYKDRHYIAKLMIEVINEVGAENVIQVITDNAPVCKAAGAIVEARFPHIFWTPCVVHTLNLALKNIDLEAHCPLYEAIYDVLVDRWTKSCTPLHCMAHSLNPRYYSREWLDGGPNRVAPNTDEEISLERNKCLRRYFPDVVERNIVINEFSKFTGLGQAFSEPDSLESRASLLPKDWWSYYGTSAPKLQKIALKLLGQPSSSSCCERNWSTYSFIHSLRRNKILPQRADDLVYVHSNLRLLSRRNELYNQGRSKMWDIGGDAWANPFDGVGMLTIANLSLDEPEIEDALISNNTEEDEENE
ncbi:hypothetical protein KSP39_PZI016120 [Platanthera zijinensis]|uniref:DUF659 domain-containing protein n=1 Tax=Platanthera zijinensis TaxID=2320716 RepID=A0AAP0B610_9ASPA